MIVPDQVRKTVVFLGLKTAQSEVRYVGSAFFYGIADMGQEKADPVYLVTARHVIDGVRALGLDTIALRANLKDGTSKWFTTKAKDWFTHPTDSTIDVALLRMGIPDCFDHLAIPSFMAASEQTMRENEVALGDEVCIVGLFKHHMGNKRNIPIIRVGNLASFGEEPVSTELGHMVAELIEARSIGGLSGSPVFLNLGITRMIGGQVMNASSGPKYWFFGLVHGHFDERSSLGSAGVGSGLSSEMINTGIAIIVPVRSIIGVISEFGRSQTRSRTANPGFDY